MYLSFHYLDTISVETEKLTGRIKHTKLELEHIKSHEELLYEDYAEHLMSEHDYVYTRERYQKKKENYCRTIKELNDKIKDIQKEKEEENLCLNTMLSFSMETHLTKPMANAFVKRVTVYRGKRVGHSCALRMSTKDCWSVQRRVRRRWQMDKDYIIFLYLRLSIEDER